MLEYPPYILAILFFPLSIMLHRRRDHWLRRAVPVFALPLFLLGAYLHPEEAYPYLFFAFIAFVLFLRPAGFGRVPAG